jgi:hypothetical protein
MKRANIAAGVIVFAFGMIGTIKPSEQRLPDPKPDERIEILKVRPIPLNVTTPDRFMLIDQTADW